MFAVQSTQQGGQIAYDGTVAVWQHYDPATGAHATPDTILEQGLALVNRHQ